MRKDIDIKIKRRNFLEFNKRKSSCFFSSFFSQKMDEKWIESGLLLYSDIWVKFKSKISVRIRLEHQIRELEYEKKKLIGDFEEQVEVLKTDKKNLEKTTAELKEELEGRDQVRFWLMIYWHIYLKNIRMSRSLKSDSNVFWQNFTIPRWV